MKALNILSLIGVIYVPLVFIISEKTDSEEVHTLIGSLLLGLAVTVGIVGIVCSHQFKILSKNKASNNAGRIIKTMAIIAFSIILILFITLGAMEDGAEDESFTLDIFIVLMRLYFQAFFITAYVFSNRVLKINKSDTYNN